MFHICEFSMTGMRGGCILEKGIEKPEMHCEETVAVCEEAGYSTRVMAVVPEQ